MSKSALLIIDMQNDFCLPGAPFFVNGAPIIIPNIQRVLEGCRQHNIPIVHVIRYYNVDGSNVELTRFHDFDRVGGALIEGTPGAEIVDQLKPKKGEYVITKHRWSAFFQTELDNLLKRLGVEQIVVAGVQTPNCIRSTVWDANSLDYEIIVLSDGTGAKTEQVHQNNLYDMKMIGITIMTSQELLDSLPHIPHENLRQKIRARLGTNLTKTNVTLP